MGSPTPRPLRARPGARFTCHSDGLCCTDVHLLGPVTRTDKKRLDVVAPRSAYYEEAVNGLSMKTALGGCAQLINGLCGIHMKHGAREKPATCWRFPFGLVATPRGGRITTEHRCPCRTMGEREPVDVESAEHSLVGNSGRVESNVFVEDKVRLSGRSHVTFAEYESIEARALAALDAGKDPKRVLDSDPYPPLRRKSWPGIADELYAQRDGTASGEAFTFFAAEISREMGVKPTDPRPAERMWKASFDRAQKRTRKPHDPKRMLADFIADQLWGCGWVIVGYDVGRAELATRVAIAESLHRRFVREGSRTDRAMAEAIMVVELVGACPIWDDAMEDISLVGHPYGPAVIPAAVAPAQRSARYKRA